MALSDDEGALKEFMADGGYTFPVMPDPGDLGTRYGVRAIPTHVVIDSEGRVAKTIVGGVTAADLSSAVDDLTR